MNSILCEETYELNETMNLKIESFKRWTECHLNGITCLMRIEDDLKIDNIGWIDLNVTWKNLFT